VLAELSPIQANLFGFDAKSAGVGGNGREPQELSSAAGEEEDFISFVEGEEPLGNNEKTRKEWKFG
jgi:hypothetical protein